MTDLLKLILGFLTSLLRSRAAVEAENLALRQQINVFRRRMPKRPQYRSFSVRLALSVVSVRPGRDCDRQTGNDHPLAPGWLSGVLALEIAKRCRKTEGLG
jgi:hypothetical protein